MIPVGLNEDVVRYISKVKGEPEWLLDFRLKAFSHWKTMTMPRWAHLDIPEIDFQAISYYAAPKVKDDKLAELGVIFCSISEAVKDYPDLVKKYLGSVVSYRDNFFAALNSAVFSDGSFVYIPKGVRCPMELSTYFRINAAGTGQFERTLIVADDDAYVDTGGDRLCNHMEIPKLRAERRQLRG